MFLTYNWLARNGNASGKSMSTIIFTNCSQILVPVLHWKTFTSEGIMHG